MQRLDDYAEAEVDVEMEDVAVGKGGGGGTGNKEAATELAFPRRKCKRLNTGVVQTAKCIQPSSEEPNASSIRGQFVADLKVGEAKIAYEHLTQVRLSNSNIPQITQNRRRTTERRPAAHLELRHALAVAGDAAHGLARAVRVAEGALGTAEQVAGNHVTT